MDVVLSMMNTTKRWCWLILINMDMLVGMILIDKISNILSDEKKRNKLRNLLYGMSKKDESIKNIGTSRKPKWVRS